MTGKGLVSSCQMMNEYPHVSKEDTEAQGSCRSKPPFSFCVLPSARDHPPTLAKAPGRAAQGSGPSGAAQAPGPLTACLSLWPLLCSPARGSRWTWFPGPSLKAWLLSLICLPSHASLNPRSSDKGPHCPPVAGHWPWQCLFPGKPRTSVACNLSDSSLQGALQPKTSFSGSFDFILN